MTVQLQLDSWVYLILNGIFAIQVIRVVVAILNYQNEKANNKKIKRKETEEG